MSLNFTNQAQGALSSSPLTANQYVLPPGDHSQQCSPQAFTDFDDPSFGIPRAPLMTPLQIDNLSHDFSLEPRQRANLHAIVKVRILALHNLHILTILADRERGRTDIKIPSDHPGLHPCLHLCWSGGRSQASKR